MKKIIIISILSFINPTLIYAHGTVVVEGVQHKDGFIDIKIYKNKEDFLEEEKAIDSIRKKAVKGKNIVPFSKIHEGEIAIVVYHDENSDGKLNTGLFWRPKEGYAFSNNYIPKGPPKFKKAAINLIHGEPVTILLNY
tara:strand:- start:80 stop:493 length:414 start_codon:yes stop_codon:yes gene_type:complete